MRVTALNVLPERHEFALQLVHDDADVMRPGARTVDKDADFAAGEVGFDEGTVHEFAARDLVDKADSA